MFTGIIRTSGTVTKHASGTLVVAAPKSASSLQPGDSLAINGTCLTVVSIVDHVMRFDLLPSTLERTTIGQLAVGDCVNIEASLRANDRIDGHFVTGHVDTIGTVIARTETGDTASLTVSFAPIFDRLVAAQGSVALDGVSLTIVDRQSGSLTIQLTPTTQTLTTLGTRQVGDIVNIEFDILARYVESHLAQRGMS